MDEDSQLLPKEHMMDLSLMFVTSWRERTGEMRRFWKGYDFAILDDLEESGLISSSRHAKSAYLTEDGERKAQRLLRSYRTPIDQPR
jgi:DNA-binding PadR family transcriptional regulator